MEYRLATFHLTHPIQMKPVGWRWARNGAIIGAIIGPAIALADLLLAWRRNFVEPWRWTGVTANIEHILHLLVISAFIGFALGFALGHARDLLRRRGG